MGKKHLIDRLALILFDDLPADVSEQEKTIAHRYREAFTYWLDKPMAGDAELRDYLMDTFNLSKSQAYRDIPNIKLLLGNVRNAGKEWHRHRVNTMLEEAYQAAKDGHSAKAKAIAAVAKAYVENNMLNVADGEQIPWDEIIPPTFEPSSDPTTIGLKPIPNLRERISQLLDKFGGEIEIDTVAIPLEDSDERDQTDIL